MEDENAFIVIDFPEYFIYKSDLPLQFNIGKSLDNMIEYTYNLVYDPITVEDDFENEYICKILVAKLC